MSRKEENTAFICANCGKQVLPLTNGSYRNHCPFCLYSLHVDFRPGDRASGCGGLMEPVGLTYHSRKGYQILHRCLKCGAMARNKIAENTVMPDKVEILARLAAKGGPRKQERKRIK